MSIRNQVYDCEFKKIQKTVPFFAEQNDKEFVNWICPLLETKCYVPTMYIHRKHDKLDSLYFIQQGWATYALQSCDNFAYANVSQGEQIGSIDLLYNMRRNQKSSGSLNHHFSVNCLNNCVLLGLKVEDVFAMKT